MGYQPESPHLQALFKPALQEYEEKVGASLAQHPLAIKLQNCDSVEAITGLLHDQARPFIDLQGSDKIMKSIKSTVSILSKISSTTSLADAFSPVLQQELVVYFTPLTLITDTPTRKSDTSLSRYLA